MDTRVTFRQQYFGADFIHFFQTPAGHGDGIGRKGPAYAAARPTANGFGVVMGQLDEVWRYFFYGLPGFVVNTGMPAQVAWIMVSHNLAGTHIEIKIFEEL